MVGTAHPTCAGRDTIAGVLLDLQAGFEGHSHA